MTGLDAMQVGNSSISNYSNKSKWVEAEETVDFASALDATQRSSENPWTFHSASGKGHAPYEELAEDGVIAYKDAVFVLDYEKNQMQLGDVTDKSKCLTITLSEGGTLIVNRDNLDQLATAVPMFSPKDQFIILKALARERKIQEVKGERDTIDTIMLGSRAYNTKQWNNLLSKVDKEEESIKEEIERKAEEEKEAKDARDQRNQELQKEEVLQKAIQKSVAGN